MADLERGERIKTLREAAHLTQPAVAERIPVGLRSVQKWEVGGGIKWENIEPLAEILNSTPEYILTGRPQITTDDDIEASEGGVVDRLAALERWMHEIRDLLMQLIEGRLEDVLDDAERDEPEDGSSSGDATGNDPS